MAFTERYVTSAASGGGDGSSGNPWTLAEAFANAAAGDRVNIQSDSSYSLGATTVTNNGTVADYLVFRGYNSTIGDLEDNGRNADGSLDTTGFPAITLTGALQLQSFNLLQNLNIDGALNTFLVGHSTTDSWAIVECKILNTQNQSGAVAVRGDNDIVVINSDLKCSGTTRNLVIDVDSRCSLIGCRIEDGGTSTAQMVQMNDGVLMNCVFIGQGAADGVHFIAFANPLHVIGNTFYNLDIAIRMPNTNNSAVHNIFINNHITDCAVGIEGLYSTTPNAIIEINSRTRDNTTAARQTLGDGPLIGEVTTDTGGPSTDYVDTTSDNLRLISGAPGESAGMIDYEDIGAYQREPSAGGGGLLVNPGTSGGMRG